MHIRHLYMVMQNPSGMRFRHCSLCYPERSADVGAVQKREGTIIPTLHRFNSTYFYQTSNHCAGKKLDAISHVVGLYEGSICLTDRNHLVLPMPGTVTIRLNTCGDSCISPAMPSDEPFHYACRQTSTYLLPEKSRLYPAMFLQACSFGCA